MSDFLKESMRAILEDAEVMLAPGFHRGDVVGFANSDRVRHPDATNTSKPIPYGVREIVGELTADPQAHEGEWLLSLQLLEPQSLEGERVVLRVPYNQPIYFK